jgi:outer membrane protein
MNEIKSRPMKNSLPILPCRAAPFMSLPLAFALALFATTALAQEKLAEGDLSERMKGDAGAAIYASTNPVTSDGTTLVAVPYFYFDYGRFFARFDTFGFKTLPLGYGHLEVVGRINLDGYSTDNATLRGLDARQNSVPLGIGTFQETPIGGFFLNAFYDANQSGSRLYEVIYASEFEVGSSTVYPMLGIEHFSRRYTQYFYGVSPAEAGRSRFPAYAPKATTTPMLGFVWEAPVAGDWMMSLYALRRWLGPAIRNSPLVNTRLQDEAFIALSYRYK